MALQRAPGRTRVCNAGITRARQPSPCRLSFESGEWRTTGMAGIRRHRSRRITLLVGASIAAIALAGGPVAAEEEGGERNLPIEFVHNNLEEAPVAGAVWAAGPALKNGDAICSTPPTNDANVNVSCEGTGPHNETHDRGQPHRPRQPDRGRQRLPARDQPGRPRRRLDPLAGDRVVRRRRELDRLPHPDDVDLPGDGRPGRRLRRRRQRLLRHPRLPVRRPGQRPEPGHPRLGHPRTAA